MSVVWPYDVRAREERKRLLLARQRLGLVGLEENAGVDGPYAGASSAKQLRDVQAALAEDQELRLVPFVLCRANIARTCALNRT